MAHRVHAGVGPAGGARSRGGPGQLFDRVFEHLLNCSEARLRCQPWNSGAVVCEGELNVAHRPNSFRQSHVGGHELEEFFGDLDGVGGGALAEVVADAPEQQRIGPVQVRPDAADEHVVLAGGGGGQRIAASGGSSTTVTPGDRDQISRACSGEIGRSVSIRIDSLCESGTGTRTHVGLTSIEESPMILRVSLTIFISSLV